MSLWHFVICVNLLFSLSTVVNSVAYRAIALDFELWARTRKEVQRVHLEHFITLLQTSRFKKFNTKQRFAKLGLVRKLLFVLQTEWYSHDTIPFVVDALRVVAQANFSADDAIKPIISYLAANLHEGILPSPWQTFDLNTFIFRFPQLAPVTSPQSVMSRIDYGHHREKAEQVMESLLSILAVPACYTKFTATLPLTRICILLLGENPSPVVAAQVLRLISMSLGISSSFSRKFELVSGWSILRIVLPCAWDPGVHEATFDILLGRVAEKKASHTASTTVVCSHIVPAIFVALHRGLDAVAHRPKITVDTDAGSPTEGWFYELLPSMISLIMSIASSPASLMTESSMEVLVEELIDLHASSPTFRQVFRSQQTTQLFVDAYKAFVTAVSSSTDINPRAIKLLEKISHFSSTLSLDNDVAGPQKREVCVSVIP
jgi:hypothetical protein